MHAHARTRMRNGTDERTMMLSECAVSMVQNLQLVQASHSLLPVALSWCDRPIPLATQPASARYLRKNKPNQKQNKQTNK